ncbi:MAG: hypothetical protein ACFWUE_10965 [Xylanivirga thermophila]
MLNKYIGSFNNHMKNKLYKEESLCQQEIIPRASQ